MAAQGVVQQLRDLAADPQNRRKIVQDQGCLPGLVLLLDHNEDQVVVTALEALRFLAECSSNRPIMKAELGMMFSLEAIMHNTTSSNRAKMLAKQVYQKLTARCVTPTPLQESRNTAINQQQQMKKQPTVKPSKGFFLGTNKNNKVVILQIKGLKDQVCRKACEEELLKTKGVISFTFDLLKGRCTLRVKKEMRTETLVAAISRTKIMSADQVLKNEQGEEIILSFGSKPALANKENAALPDYLPEEDSPIRGLDKAVTKPGMVGDEDKQASWLSTAASFISSSFYW
ncbi:Armadillo repeat-containing protein 1 [Holothuria leucospilota]|uniref:Armadillo repeat-containing protein 1 n=1 Tax=Holothuria leucospilota TaxID=206669 RepID=A0A9Q1BV10_HOLLE|nr:Armadillo repeat-containing protein 1 [Holothuria leucospilota]